MRINAQTNDRIATITLIIIATSSRCTGGVRLTPDFSFSAAVDFIAKCNQRLAASTEAAPVGGLFRVTAASTTRWRRSTSTPRRQATDGARAGFLEPGLELDPSFCGAQFIAWSSVAPLLYLVQLAKLHRPSCHASGAHRLAVRPSMMARQPSDCCWSRSRRPGWQRETGL